MAKITIVGDAYVVTSSLTLSDLLKIQKYAPCALVLKDAEGKTPIFGVCVGSGSGSINANGAEFAPTTSNADGFATITVCVKGGITGDAKEFVAEQLGTAILRLNELEDTLPAVIADIDAKKAQVLGNITVA